MKKNKIIKYLGKDQFIKNNKNNINYINNIIKNIKRNNLSKLNIGINLVKNGVMYTVTSKVSHEDWEQDIIRYFNININKRNIKNFMVAFMMNDVLEYENLKKCCDGLNDLFCETKVINFIENTPCFICSKAIKKSEFYIETVNFNYIPDTYMINNIRMENMKNKSIDIKNHKNKKIKIFWAGSPQNHFYDIRYKILDIQTKKNNSLYIDAYFGSKTIEDALNYQFIASMEGWSSSWDRTVWISGSKSVLFKETDSDHKSFYDIFIKPYKHYIPYKKDLYEIVKVYGNIRSKNSILNKIIKNSNEINRDIFFDSFISKMFTETFNGYSNEINISASYEDNHFLDCN